MPVLRRMAPYQQRAVIKRACGGSCLECWNRAYCRVSTPTVNAADARSARWLELLTRCTLRNMNANPTPGQVSTTQLTTLARFDDLRNRKSLDLRDVGRGGGIEPNTQDT